MANKAVFLDRDNTLISDPGYLSDADAVKLLPGVDLALKSLVQAGYKLVVVTNQAGIARGLITESALEKIHAELRRQLGERDVHLDAMYYCPYHPEGTVEGYVADSDMRKPKPGMLLQGARELDIDLSQSWMVGDSPSDVGAGQRAGCRTIRVRLLSQEGSADGEDEDVQADFTVRNLVDASRVILRENSDADGAGPATRGAPAGISAATSPAPTPTPPGRPARIESMGDGEVLREILSRMRRDDVVDEEFSIAKMVAGVLLMCSGAAVLVGLWNLFQAERALATLWAALAAAGGVISLALYTMRRDR